MDQEPDCDEAYVCQTCLEYPGLDTFIQRNSESTSCSYCGSSSDSPIAAPLVAVIERIIDGISELYGQADDEGVPYDGREGGYQLPVYGSHEILNEVGLYIENDQLRRCVTDNLPDIVWSERDPFSLRQEDSLRYGWRDFCEAVKHDVRYLMFPPPDDDPNHDEITPSEMLDALGQVVNDIAPFDALTTIKAIFRARVHDIENLPITIAELGPAPRSVQIHANRMSAAGIGLFYGAFDVETAIAETVTGRDAGRYVTIGHFHADSAVVLDLTNLPPIPSIFDDEDKRVRRAGLIFLHDFREAIAAPIQRDGREHIEYVPSQIVTEYLRYRHELEDGGKLAGIVYPSARHSGGTCCVLFVQAEELVEQPYGRRAPRVRLHLVSSKCHTRRV